MDNLERLAQDLLKLRHKAIENVENNPDWAEVFHTLSKHWFTIVRLIPIRPAMGELDTQEEEQP